MDKALVKSFINWLESATEKEIIQRQNEAKALLEILTTDEAKHGVKYSLHLIDQELVARYSLSHSTLTSRAA